MDEAVIGLHVEGVDQAKRDIIDLDQAIERLNSGGRAVSSGAPMVTPSGVPRPPDPLGGFGKSPADLAATTPQPFGLGMFGGPGIQPALQPGALASNPLHGAPAGSHPGGGTTIHAANVTIVSSGASSGGGAPGMMPVGAPPPPAGGGQYPGWYQNPFNPQQSSGWEKFAQQFMANPTPAGALRAGLKAIPPELAGMGALIGATALAADYDVNMYYASQRPVFENQTRLMGIDTRGDWVNPIERAAMTRIAGLQGDLAKDRAAMSPFTSIPLVGGAIGKWWEIAYGQPKEREISLTQDIADFQMQAAHIAAMGGIAPESLDTHRTETSYENSLLGGSRRVTRGITTPYGRFTGDSMLRAKSQLADLAAQFGTGGVRGLMDSDLARYTGAGIDKDAVLRASQSIYNLASRPEYTDVYAGLNSHQSVDSFAHVAAMDAISRGDRSALVTLFPLLRKQGFDTDAMMAQAQAVNALQSTQSISQSALGQAQAGISMMGVTGASYQQISGAQRAMSGNFSPIISVLQQRLAVAANPMDRARLQTEIANAQAQQSGQVYQAQQTFYEGWNVENQTAAMAASTGMNQAMYGGGGERGVWGAFGAQQGAAGHEVARLRQMSRDPVYAPHIRAMYAQQAAAKETEQNIDIPRQAGQFLVGMRQSEIQIGGAQAGLAMAGASLFGGPNSVYQAALGQASVTGEQYRLTKTQLDNARELRLSPQEENELRARAIELQRDYNQQMEVARRTLLDMNVSVARAGQSFTQLSGQIQFQYYGVGGAAGAGIVGANVDAANTTLRRAQEKFDALSNLDHDNPAYLDAKNQLQQAKAGKLDSLESYANVPMPVGMQRKSLENDFRMNVMGRTYAGYGDVRATLKSQMGNISDQLGEVESLRRKQMADIDRQTDMSPEEKKNAKEVAELNFAKRRIGLGNEAINAQQQLEQGWMDRLISQQINMPSRGAFVATQFTNKEAAPFLQLLNSNFGFSGDAGADARDYYRDRGPMIANSIIQNVSRPEGFSAFALNHVPAAAPSVTRAAGQDLTIRVIVVDRDGREIGRQTSSRNVRDIANGAFDVSASRYTAGTSRQ